MGEAQVAERIAAEVTGWGGETQAVRIGGELGVFSTVYKVVIGDRSCVVKLPRIGPNGDAARASGAYEREMQAYRHLITPAIPSPAFHGLVELDHGPAFVLEDLTSYETVDQLDGLSAEQALSVTEALVQCHGEMQVESALEIGVRRSSPNGFKPEALERGVPLVPDPDVFESLLQRRAELVSRFGTLPDPVVCHGDPRADNLVLAPQVKLFDWQQIAIQAGEADLAWLCATSLIPEVRRSVESELVGQYADRVGRPFGESWERYRLAMIVPGLAVLLLVQRHAPGRLERHVEVSVSRISDAVADHLSG